MTIDNSARAWPQSIQGNFRRSRRAVNFETTSPQSPPPVTRVKPKAAVEADRLLGPAIWGSPAVNGKPVLPGGGGWLVCQKNAEPVLIIDLLKGKLSGQVACPEEAQAVMDFRNSMMQARTGASGGKGATASQPSSLSPPTSAKKQATRIDAMALYSKIGADTASLHPQDDAAIRALALKNEELSQQTLELSGLAPQYRELTQQLEALTDCGSKYMQLSAERSTLLRQADTTVFGSLRAETPAFAYER